MDKTAAIGQKQAIDLVRQYKRIIARHFSEEPQVMLYGSYSKGTENKDSDIDVAVIVSSYGDRKLELSKALWRDVDDVSLLIEPVLISKEFPSPLYDDVIRTGIAV
jgi:predicted nucleotidyltransferase